MILAYLELTLDVCQYRLADSAGALSLPTLCLIRVDFIRLSSSYAIQTSMDTVSKEAIDRSFD